MRTVDDGRGWASCVTRISGYGPRAPRHRGCARPSAGAQGRASAGVGNPSGDARRASLGTRPRAVLRRRAGASDVRHRVGERPAAPEPVPVAANTSDADRLAPAPRPLPHLAPGTGATDRRTTGGAHGSPCPAPHPERGMLTQRRAVQSSHRPPRPSGWWRATGFGNRATRRSLRYAVPALWGAVAAMQSCFRDDTRIEPRTTVRGLASGRQAAVVRPVLGSRTTGLRARPGLLRLTVP